MLEFWILAANQERIFALFVDKVEENFPSVSSFKQLNGPPVVWMDAEMVFNAARNGVSWAQEIISETVDYLAIGIAAISVILDPQVIVLGGGVSRSADLLIEPILCRLEGVLPAPVELVVSTLGYRAAVMGAIMLVLDAATEHVALKTS